MTEAWVHHYISTACEHALGENRPDLHASCRLSCKFAEDGVESCRCPCHTGTPPEEFPLPPVDQARNIAGELWAVIHRWPHLVPRALRDRIDSDRHLFWLRGEVQPPGVWTPPATGGNAGQQTADDGTES